MPSNVGLNMNSASTGSFPAKAWQGYQSSSNYLTLPEKSEEEKTIREKFEDRLFPEKKFWFGAASGIHMTGMSSTYTVGTATTNIPAQGYGQINIYGSTHVSGLLMVNGASSQQVNPYLVVNIV